MKIEILCTGDEILTGKTINTNYSFMAQRLTEAGLQVSWGTTVGDDHDSLSLAFQQAAERADAVIVNGGLGPTVDDLSQELAAQAAGVELVLHEEWLQKLETFYKSRGRVMPPNNRKQAMLPAGCEFIDNPVGTACGFAVDIGKARFFFTPGVPREMRRMVTEQVIPRILKLSGLQVVTRLKRFHSFGIGESRADELLKSVDELLDGSSVKLGFQSHYPQLETKLAAIASDEPALEAMLAPIEEKVRQCFGNFILCEDDETLEGVVLNRLQQHSATLATLEMTTGGALSTRLVRADSDTNRVQRGIVSRALPQLAQSVGLNDDGALQVSADTAKPLAQKLRASSQTDYALVLLVSQEPIDENLRSGAEIVIAIASAETVNCRQARLMGGQEWVQLGSVEMALDALRRKLTGLPLDEKIDFEQQ